MKRVTWLGLALLLLLVACSGSGQAAFTTVQNGLDVGVTETTSASAATTAAASEAPTGVPVATDRQVIYDGSIHFQAANTRDAFDRIVLLVQSSGGLLASSQVGEAVEEEQPTISLTVRIPTGELTATLNEIRAVADRVITESLQSQDVTDQFVDIEAQLRNLYALEEELLVLLAELRDNNNADPAKLLQVFDQIRITRGEIEQLEGRKQMLTNLVSLATLSMTISPLPAAIPIVPTDPVWEPATQAKEALRSLVSAMQSFGGWVIRFALYTLPVLVLTAGPFIWLAWYLYRRVNRKSAAA